MSDPTFTPAEADEAERLIRETPMSVLRRTYPEKPPLTKAGALAARFGARPLSPVDLFALISELGALEPESETIRTPGCVRILLMFNDLSRLTLECADGTVGLR